MQSNAVLWFFMFVLMTYFTEASRKDCRAPVTAEGEKAEMTFFVRPEISMSTAPFFLYVKRGDDTDTLQCERSSSLINITCGVNNALVQSKGIINNSLTIVFTNVTQGMQGHYKLHVHFNGSWSIQGCNLTVKGLRDANIDVKDSGNTTVIAVIVPLLLLVVITILVVGVFCYFRRKRSKKKDHDTFSDERQHSMDNLEQEQKNQEKNSDELLKLVGEYNETQQSNKTSPDESAARLLPSEDNAAHSPDELENMPWYVGNIARKEGVRLLKLPQNGHGSFLIRVSQMDSSCYTLSVNIDGVVTNFRIHQKTDLSGFYLERSQRTFPTLPNLVQHHSEQADGLPCILSRPCQRDLKNSLDSVYSSEKQIPTKPVDEETS